MKWNKFTRAIAVICLVSHLTTQVGADRAVLFSHLAPASTFAAPEKSRPAVSKKTSRRPPSGKRGLAAKLAPIVVALAQVLPGTFAAGAAVLAYATPAYAQDAPLQRVSDLVEQLKLAIRTQNAWQALESLRQIRALEPREKLAALNKLIEQLNSSDMDYDKQPEILDALLETIFSIIESNRSQMIQLRLVRESSGQERVIYAHPPMVRVEEIPDILMREMARRMRKIAHREPLAADHSDDVETRLAGQIFRLYFRAARVGFITLDLELMDELTQLLTESPNRFHRRIIFGFIQGIGEAPASSATLSRVRDWLARLERFCQSQRGWDDATRRHGERLFRTARESLTRRALEEISLPTEASVDRNPPAPVATATQAAPPAAQPQVQLRFPIGIFLALALPLVALGVAGYYILKKIRVERLRQRIGIVTNPNLAELLPEKPPDFQPPKLKEIEVQKYLPRAPEVPLTRAITSGVFKVAPYVQADAPGLARKIIPGVYSVFVSHIVTITAFQRGYYFLFQNTESIDSVGHRRVRALDSVTGQMVILKEILLHDDQKRIKRHLWLNETQQGQWSGGILHRAWDETSQKEILLVNLGTLLFFPTPVSSDSLERNFNYWAYDLVDHKETTFYETGNFLIEVGASETQPVGSVHRAWDWQSRTQTTVTEFNGFYIVKKLGQGGMGRADLAWDPKTKRYVVIKRMLPDALQDEIFVERFKREIEVMGKLEPHPNILTIHQCGTDPVLYYVMPFVDGESLNVVASRKFKQQGTFSLSETIELVIQAAQGVGAAHRKGIIHRDLKLENLFLTRYGKVLVADFGLAHDRADVRNTRLTQSQDIMGTPTYMSPEQINEPKNIDDRTDLYALGVLLYHLSTGHTPFEEYKKGPYGLLGRKGIAQQHDRYQRVSRLKPEYPLGFNDIVERALAFDPAKRYQTAEALIGDLEALRQNPTQRFNQEAWRRARLKIQQAQALADPNARRRIYEGALEDLRQAAQENPELRNNPRYYFLHAVIYAGLGDQQRMVEYLDQFDQSLQHAPNPGEFQREREQAEELRARLRALQQTGFRIPELDPRRENPFNLAA